MYLDVSDLVAKHLRVAEAAAVRCWVCVRTELGEPVTILRTEDDVRLNILFSYIFHPYQVYKSSHL